MNIQGFGRQRSGGPLRALVGLFLCWIAVRATLFELPFERPDLPDLTRAIAGQPPPVPFRLPALPGRTTREGPSGHAPSRVSSLESLVPPIDRVAPLPVAPLLPAQSGIQPQAVRIAAGHNLLWLASMQGMPLLPAVQAAVARDSRTKPGDVSASNASRWSADGWLFWRSGGRGLTAAGAVMPVYGGSQAGAVLRYGLARDTDYRPTAYLRAVHALGGPSEGDLAAGLAVRPLPRLPLTVHAEARLARRGESLTVVPAAFVSAGIEGASTDGAMALRGYAQLGYVGGRGATGFADGSLVAEKRLSGDDHTTLAVGGGAWGGVQRGAGRLDLGPSASLRLRLGEGAARLSADYRLRVAGDAAPAQGAAVTLTAGF